MVWYRRGGRWEGGGGGVGGVQFGMMWRGVGLNGGGVVGCVCVAWFGTVVRVGGGACWGGAEHTHSLHAHLWRRRNNSACSTNRPTNVSVLFMLRISGLGGGGRTQLMIIIMVW